MAFVDALQLTAVTGALTMVAACVVSGRILRKAAG
jgi:hypothetical protein